MKLVLRHEDGKDSIYIGDVPDPYDDESWARSEQLLQQVCDLIRTEFGLSRGNDEHSFVIESEEFSIFMDDLMPIAIYAKKVTGNPIIKKIYEVLNRS